MSIHKKKKLAVFSLTCCEGCQFALLNHYEKFVPLLNFYELTNFRLIKDESEDVHFDVALVEGTPEDDDELKHLKEIRKHSDVLIALGSCADLGGIQSERNHLPEKLHGKKDVQTLDELVKVDGRIPGCPINQDEAIAALLDIYWGKDFKIPDIAVCYECRKNGNECLIKQGKPCLGPVTLGGCGSICVNSGEMCLGCRGPIKRANFHKLREVLAPLASKEDIENYLTIYGDIEKKHEKFMKEENG